MADAAVKADLEIAYAYDPDASKAGPYLERFGVEPFAGITHDSIMQAPDFHVLLLNLHSDALTVPEQPKRARIRKFDEPVEHAMRFLSQRRPVGFLLIGEDLPEGFVWDVLNVIQAEVLRWGYAFECREESGLAAIAGSLHAIEPFPWPKPLTLDEAVDAIRRAALVPGLRADMV
ncbi:MAG: hypothetical protein F4W95_07110 [Chloroflexi bacterium]|nr:hypothetical protein [Chloroflexota bacterium]